MSLHAVLWDLEMDLSSLRREFPQSLLRDCGRLKRCIRDVRHCINVLRKASHILTREEVRCIDKKNALYRSMPFALTSGQLHDTREPVKEFILKKYTDDDEHISPRFTKVPMLGWLCRECMWGQELDEATRINERIKTLVCIDDTRDPQYEEYDVEIAEHLVKTLQKEFKAYFDVFGCV